MQQLAAEFFDFISSARAESPIKEIFDALPPTGQMVFGAVIMAVGAFLAVRGLMDGFKRSPELPPQHDPRVIPTWLMYGPLHDMMQSVHEIAEQGRMQCENQRTQLAVMRDIDKAITRFNNGQEYTHRLMEAILNDQQGVSPPMPRRHKE